MGHTVTVNNQLESDLLKADDLVYSTGRLLISDDAVVILAKAPKRNGELQYHYFYASCYGVVAGTDDADEIASWNLRPARSGESFTIKED